MTIVQFAHNTPSTEIHLNLEQKAELVCFGYLKSPSGRLYPYKIRTVPLSPEDAGRVDALYRTIVGPGSKAFINLTDSRVYSDKAHPTDLSNCDNFREIHTIFRKYIQSNSIKHNPLDYNKNAQSKGASNGIENIMPSSSRIALLDKSLPGIPETTSKRAADFLKKLNERISNKLAEKINESATKKTDRALKKEIEALQKMKASLEAVSLFAICSALETKYSSRSHANFITSLKQKTDAIQKSLEECDPRGIFDKLRRVSKPELEESEKLFAEKTALLATNRDQYLSGCSEFGHFAVHCDSIEYPIYQFLNSQPQNDVEKITSHPLFEDIMQIQGMRADLETLCHPPSPSP